jgi:hypothetical protein
MLIYNHKKEFIGISQICLEKFNFKDFAQLRDMVDDFADFFTSEPSYIHNFIHIHWIDYILCDENGVAPKVMLNIKNIIYTADLNINLIYLLDAPSKQAYEINLLNIKVLSKDLQEIKNDDKIVHEVKVSIEPVLPIITHDIHEEPTLKVKSDKTYIYNPSLASMELGLAEDLIEEFIQDFISQANNFKDNLHNAILATDFVSIKLISHKLKGVASNLRIENALELLTNINHSDNIEHIQRDVEEFYKIITILSNISIKQDSMLSFKDDV